MEAKHGYCISKEKEGRKQLLLSFVIYNNFLFSLSLSSPHTLILLSSRAFRHERNMKLRERSSERIMKK
jgi:hypothetical protein